MALGLREVVRRLGYHRPTSRTVPVFEHNRHLAIELMLHWDETLPDGFEKDQSLLRLQESLMWANAAVACTTGPGEDPLPHSMPPGHGEDLPPGAVLG